MPVGADALSDVVPSRAHHAFSPAIWDHAVTASLVTRLGFIPARLISPPAWRETPCAPLPEYVEPVMGPVARPDLDDDFPLILTSAKSPHYLQSQLRGLAALRRIEPDPRVELHPDTAAARGIEDSAWVALVTPHGRDCAPRHVSPPRSTPRAVSTAHGWWQACEALSQPGYDAESEAGANMNAAIGKDAIDPISGSVPFKSYLCQVERLTET